MAAKGAPGSEQVREIPSSELYRFKNHPFKVKDDAATIIMVESNLQRKGLLSSERTFIYKMKHFGRLPVMTGVTRGIEMASEQKKKFRF